MDFSILFLLGISSLVSWIVDEISVDFDLFLIFLKDGSLSAKSVNNFSIACVNDCVWDNCTDWILR